MTQFLKNSERSCYDTSGSKPTNAQCVESAVNHAPAFTVNPAIFMCSYKGKMTRNEEKFTAATKELILILEWAGCALDVILKIREDQTLKEASAAAGKTLEDVARELFELLDTLHLSEGATQILCALADDALLSTCMAKALTNNVSPLLDILKAFLCEGDRNAVTAKDVVQLLRNAACFGDDALGTGDTVEELVTKPGESLEGLVQKVLDLLQPLIGPSGVLNDLACKVIGISDGGLGGMIG
ncbi:ranaspumin-like isoform X2 [Engystomops pustulosus]|uniref:ranaspumin-like isoform X2 n=1 Tax=Engystomops pustulosus TaxID=76066 RepID=UPI003AFA3E34